MYVRFVENILQLGGVTRAHTVVRRNPSLQNKRCVKNERTLSVLDDVGFTEEESQAWLRDFRILQHENGKCLAQNEPIYVIIQPFIFANCGYM